MGRPPQGHLPSIGGDYRFPAFSVAQTRLLPSSWQAPRQLHTTVNFQTGRLEVKGEYGRINFLIIFCCFSSVYSFSFNVILPNFLSSELFSLSRHPPYRSPSEHGFIQYSQAPEIVIFEFFTSKSCNQFSPYHLSLDNNFNENDQNL